MKTAVEWLMREFQETGYISLATYEQAKEIEKYQIINASIGDGLSPEHREKAERYYNETFKKQ